MKYHTSSCYRSFQRDMAKTDSITQPLEQSELSRMRSPTLRSSWLTKMVTWGRVPNHNLGLSCLLCPLIDQKGPETSPQTHAIIIDFMALVRKVPLKKLDPPVKTFHDFAIALTSMVTKAGHNCYEIHIVFDTYREDSIKNGERERRGKSKEMVVLDVISPNQNVPVVLENFWSSSISKTAFQAFYVEWLTTNYQGTKPLYLGISPQAWTVSAGCASPFPRLNCTHKEADDRMMFHVQDILSHRQDLHPLRCHQVTQMSLCACYTTSQSIGEILVSKSSGSSATQE